MIVAGFELDEDGGDSLLAHGLAGLRASVVELGGLPDDDRAGTDDQDFFEVRHGGFVERWP